jgi:hypothetical protein
VCVRARLYWALFNAVAVSSSSWLSLFAIFPFTHMLARSANDRDWSTAWGRHSTDSLGVNLIQSCSLKRLACGFVKLSLFRSPHATADSDRIFNDVGMVAHSSPLFSLREHFSSSLLTRSLTSSSCNATSAEKWEILTTLFYASLFFRCHVTSAAVRKFYDGVKMCICKFNTWPCHQQNYWNKKSFFISLSLGRLDSFSRKKKE